MPLPSFYNPNNLDEIRLIDKMAVHEAAIEWAKYNKIKPSASDRVRVAMLLIDMQIDFCNPRGSLFVGGRSGRGAVDDTGRLCVFGYHNLPDITDWFTTLDTHTIWQLFHMISWINDRGEHPAPGTIITEDDVLKGVWKMTPALAKIVGGNVNWLAKYAAHYTGSLAKGQKYALMIWPYHTLLGEVGHALMPHVSELMLFHSIARGTQTSFEIKGGNPLTENYSILRPEVTESHEFRDQSGVLTKIPVGELNVNLFNTLMDYDVIGCAGEAGSHCWAWTVQDLLDLILAQAPELAKKVHLIEDLTSPVVIPGVVDFTDAQAEAIKKFKDAGMNVVRSTTPVREWPGYQEALKRVA
jgi:nicotinamidase-related amidase